MILIVDFGSQTCHLIGRRLRDVSVETEIIDPSQVMEAVAAKKPSGIILSGGPSSVYDSGAPTIDPTIFDQGIPVLGICYGWQLMAHLMGGVVKSGHKEYGPVQLTSKLIQPDAGIFTTFLEKTPKTVWMSHGDEVLSIPPNFEICASTATVKAAAVLERKKHLFGVQFHPEVTHTEDGFTILTSFATLCHEYLSPRKLLVEKVIEEVRAIVNTSKEGNAIAAISGGVDSTVATAIVAKVMGKRLYPMYCDNGLMRDGTKEEVYRIFHDILGIEPIIIDCKDEFLTMLQGVTDGKIKRKLIGAKFIEVFEREAKKIPNVQWLVQGTLYSDFIESKGTALADTIRLHHNVGGLPEKLNIPLLEPVKMYYKDEVRALGRLLGLPEDVVSKQPLPGPGQAIRILGEVTEVRLERQQYADRIVLEVLKDTGWYDKVFQSFTVLTGVDTTCVKGDGGQSGELVGLRIYDSSDIMSAGWSRLPYDVLQTIASRIVNEVPGVSRVAYDITTKPPATMEWE
jgi:GMP synthase (glutamine-hydrolysing)